MAWSVCIYLLGMNGSTKTQSILRKPWMRANEWWWQAIAMIDHAQWPLMLRSNAGQCWVMLVNGGSLALSDHDERWPIRQGATMGHLGLGAPLHPRLWP